MGILWGLGTLFFIQIYFSTLCIDLKTKRQEKKKLFFKEICNLYDVWRIVLLFIPLICSMVLMIIPIKKVLTILNFLCDLAHSTSSINEFEYKIWCQRLSQHESWTKLKVKNYHGFKFPSKIKNGTVKLLLHSWCL